MFVQYPSIIGTMEHIFSRGGGGGGQMLEQISARPEGVCSKKGIGSMLASRKFLSVHVHVHVQSCVSSIEDG